MSNSIHIKYYLKEKPTLERVKPGKDEDSQETPGAKKWGKTFPD